MNSSTLLKQTKSKLLDSKEKHGPKKSYNQENKSMMGAVGSSGKLNPKLSTTVKKSIAPILGYEREIKELH